MQLTKKIHQLCSEFCSQFQRFDCPWLHIYADFFNKTLKCDPKGELGHSQSGVCDLPCDDLSLVTSTTSASSLYINVIIVS